MKLFDVVLLTQQEYLLPKTLSEYNQNILLEDALLRGALEKYNLRVARKGWDDADFDWSTTKYVVFRTPWDYFHRYAEFSAWLAKAVKQTSFLNHPETIFWNIDKHYLADLASKGFPVVKTQYIEAGTHITLRDVFTSFAIGEIIIKPAISGTARHTYRITEQVIDAHENIFQQLVAKECMLVQPFLESILTRGEITLVVLDGKFTHAVLKRAKTGDFRVQDDFGGTVHDYIAANDEKKFAEQVFQSLSPVPVYGRIDLVWGDDGNLLISELELIEPELWMRKNPTSASIFAEGILKYF